jgi:thiol reductant ABC exporter CydD subunit
VTGLDPRLLNRAREARAALIGDAVLGIAAALLVLVQAVLLARVAARSFDGASLAAVALPLALLALVVCLRAGAAWGFETVGRRAASSVLSRLRLDVVERRLAADPASLDDAGSADLATVAVDGVAALETTFARYLPQMVLAAVVPVAVLALVASIDLTSAGVMLLTLPLVPVFMWLIGRYTEHRTHERRQALQLLSNHFADVVRGLPTLRAYNRGRSQAAQVEAVSDRYRLATMGTLRVAFLSGTVLELAATIGVALVAVTVGVRLVDGGIGFEAALTVLVLAPELYAPLRNLAAQYHASADGAAVAGRLLDVLEEPVRLTGTAPAPDLRTATIRMESVSFAYPGGGAVLEDVDLELSPGEVVALVGTSGAGKTTLASLLLRLAEPTGGRILAGGIDISSSAPASWRAQLAWLPQRPSLLHTSVAENIRLADPEADGDRVRDAALLAGADRFIRDLPDAYATIVGEGGRPLSPGQVQRLALARALLREAPLVVLDEPTANLDDESADLVLAAIDLLRAEGRTVLVIAHAPEVAARADRIVRLEAGRVAPALAEVAG